MSSNPSLPAGAALYSSLVVFGDSLSDSGNNALLGLYDPTQIVTGNAYVPSKTYASGTATDRCGPLMPPPR
jgi:outer membrane lipase/esterase